MSVVAIYNMKGGVGKTTTAVNLSYLAAASGQRALLWDLDPQAASSFAFRVRPRVAGFNKKSLKTGQTLAAAIKETDYANLDLLPADFAYRKLDRLLDRLGNPERVMTALLDVLGRDYDVVFLDCPAGFSLLTEGVLAAADAVLVPTIPTVLSLRTLGRLMKWADRADSRAEVVAFFSMVDRRKALHRRACEWSAGSPEIFLTGQIPYASIVEQMAVRRMPLAVFAPRDSATVAFAEIWAELESRLQRRAHEDPRPRDRWVLGRRAVESLVERLELADAQGPAPSHRAPAANPAGSRPARGGRDAAGLPPLSADSEAGAGPARNGNSAASGIDFVHSFDTDDRDLQRCGYVLELRERAGSLLVVAAVAGSDRDPADSTRRAEAQIDSSWARQILSGATSPLAVLELRLGRPFPGLVDSLCTLVGDRTLRRIESRSVPAATVNAEGLHAT
jgi:cellulose biosynthesis protein BcsQ